MFVSPSRQIYQGQVRAVWQQPEGAEGPDQRGAVQDGAGGEDPQPADEQGPGQGPGQHPHHRHHGAHSLLNTSPYIRQIVLHSSVLCPSRSVLCPIFTVLCLRVTVFLGFSTVSYLRFSVLFILLFASLLSFQTLCDVLHYPYCFLCCFSCVLCPLLSVLCCSLVFYVLCFLSCDACSVFSVLCCLSCDACSVFSVFCFLSTVSNAVCPLLSFLCLV